MICQGLPLCGGPFVAVSGQTGCFFASRVGSRAPSSSKNAYPSLRACKMLHILRSLSRICNVFLTKMDALLPNTNSWNSLPDLLLLVKPVRKSSSSKLDALLLNTNSWNSPPDLLLLVNAEHKMLYCLIRILRTARLICCSSMRNRDNAILSVTYYQYSPPELFSSRTKHRKKGDPMV